jgi:hypothetical protein
MEAKITIPSGRFAVDDAVLKAKREALKKKLLEGDKITLAPNGQVMGQNGSQDSSICIPPGILANDAVLKAKREALKKKLLEGDKITLAPNGQVMGQNGSQDSSISIPKGKLANDAVLKAKREALKKKLLEGGKITLAPDGKVTDQNSSQNSSISIPKGKLASQWYETNPMLLEAEKAAMAKCFPHFTLDKLDDGRLYWIGDLTPGIYETKFGHRMTYTVMAVYLNNHPAQVMGSSVRIYPVLPDVNDLIEKAGFRPFHLLRDSSDNLYLCTNEAGNVSTGNTITTAASVLAWAVKWLMSYELVLTGDLAKEKFNEHGGI